MKPLEKSRVLFPVALDHALDLLAQPGSVPLAGGTDLMVQWSSGLLSCPVRIVSLLGLDELHGIRFVADRLEIGAATTHTALRNHALVQRYAPNLAAAAAEVGARQIQERGTIGGNIANASPAADLAPSLLAADAEVALRSLAGERVLSLAAFFLGYRKLDLQPGEIITGFRVSCLQPGEHAYYRKLGVRRAQAISKLALACRARMIGINSRYPHPISNVQGREEEDQEDPTPDMRHARPDTPHPTLLHIRIAMASMAPTPIRLVEVEQWLNGQTLSNALYAECEKRVAAALHPIDDIRSTAHYRGWCAARLVRAFLESLA